MKKAGIKNFARVEFSDIPGWQDDDHVAALAAFRRSATEILETGSGFGRPVRFGGKRSQWAAVCRRAVSASNARRYFEDNFAPLRVIDHARPEGLFTGYYEPEVEGSRTKSDVFHVPIFRKPDDLIAIKDNTAMAGQGYGRMVGGIPQPYFTRREIEEGALQGRALEIVWLKGWADAFFIQVQGSGRVRLPGGSMIRLAYAAKSGRPYTAIGGLLAERGEIPRERMSMQAIRSWMAMNKEAARQLMWENQSFVFFREVEGGDPALGPPGAQKVPLSPMRSLAADRSLWMFGMPVWLDTSMPADPYGGVTEFRQLVIAQDTGSAIRGLARGDVFWGAGETAAFIAGHMKSSGTMTVLLPNDLAQSLADSK